MTRIFPIVRLIHRGVALSLMLAAASFGEDQVDFDRDVRPILSDQCFKCHGPDENARQAELRLDTQAGMFAPRDDGAAILAGKPEESELYRRITAEDDERMPPADSGLKLTERDKQLIRRWIEQGAEWADHWAFQTPQRSALPEIKQNDGAQNPIDQFVWARLKDAGLAPSPEADRVTLIRRVTLDLTGLPPTPAEVDAFLEDRSPGAYEKVVDRLLASPRYGERMAWDWLDAARYADTDGFQGDPTRTMWPWRDWLIQALNENIPFDRFTIEMLAGDLLPNAALEQVIATGFNRNHMHNGEGGRIAEETRVENVFDRTETTATVWLGLTMTCCRCHDHKFDPITQQEYYQLFAFFNNTSESGSRGGGKAPPVIEYLPAEQRKNVEELDRRIDELNRRLEDPIVELDESQAAWEAEQTERVNQIVLDIINTGGIAALYFHKSAEPAGGLPPEVAKALTVNAGQRDAGQLKTLQRYYRERNWPEAKPLTKELTELVKRRESIQKTAATVMVMDDLSEDRRRKASILERGLYSKPLDEVPAGTPAFLPPLPVEAPRDRLTLARWLVDPANPLSARVTVNRYWQTFFGEGLVTTTEDFGRQGARPSHPLLLDWLATRFIDSGWDVKALHKLIVTSATYRQSSRISQTADAPENNRLLARAARYRMPSWMLRDQALAASGLLSRRMGGLSVKPYQPEGIWAEATFGKIRYQPDTGSGLYRRSLYVFWRRIVGPTMFFDSGKRQTCEVRPTRTNTPLHALTTLNETTFVEASRAMAERVMHEAESPEQRISLAFRLATAREPNSRELAVLVRRWEELNSEFATAPGHAAELLSVGQSPRDTELDAAQHAAYAVVCSLLLNLDETLTRE